MFVTQTVLCAVVLTSPVLAMATYTASEPPNCATNVCNAHTVLCAVVLTSPVLAMATYTASEPPTCATNVCNANCVVCSGADLPGAGHGHLHRLRAAHLRYQCGRRVDQGVLSYHHQEHARQVYFLKSPQQFTYVNAHLRYRVLATHFQGSPMY
jgi:hypothetical protein